MSAMLTLLAGCSADNESRYLSTELVRGVAMHGINGLAFHADGSLYAGSVVGQAIYRIDLSTGEVTTAVAAPDGEADDLAFAADGTLAWTALIAGELRAQRPGGKPFVVAANLPMINPVAFDGTGRLFAARMQYDDLFEFYIDSQNPPRLIAQGLGQLNGFEFGADGRLYGPLPARGAVARIDVESGAAELLATGLGQVVGVDLDSEGNVYALNWESGEIFRIDPAGVLITFARLEPPLDNLVVGPDDSVYASQPSHNGVIRVEPDGRGQTMISSVLVTPGGLAVMERDGDRVLLVTDTYGFRFVDPDSGAPLPPASQLAGGSTDVAVASDLIALSYVRRGRVSLLERDTLALVKTWADLEAPYGILIQGGDPLVADFSRGQIIRLSSRTDQRTVVIEGLAGPRGPGLGRPGHAVCQRGGGRPDPAGLVGRRPAADDRHGPGPTRGAGGTRRRPTGGGRGRGRPAQPGGSENRPPSDPGRRPGLWRRGIEGAGAGLSTQRRGGGSKRGDLRHRGPDQRSAQAHSAALAWPQPPPPRSPGGSAQRALAGQNCEPGAVRNPKP